MRNRITVQRVGGIFCLNLILLVHAVPASAWWPQGHSVLTVAAVKALPQDVPAFFRTGSGLAAHLAQDPDVAKNRATPLVSDHEGPEHYIDLELLKGQALPLTRHKFIELCAKAKLDPKDVGYLPYSVAEWTERLTIAFVEYRQWPNNPHIQTKCLMYAGFLAHYAGDLCMPLHTTIHHDGRARPDGSTPRTGIHAKVDSLIEKLALKPDDLARDQQIQPYQDLLPGILKELTGSRALIDRTYELETQLPPERGTWNPSAPIIAFTTERARASTRFISSLYLSAWRKSATIKLPTWLEREPSPGTASTANPTTGGLK